MVGFWIVVGLVVAGIMAAVVLSHHPLLKMTSRATGQVVRSEERELRDPRRGRHEETVIVVAFMAGRDERQITVTVEGRQARRYPPGRSVEVRYNPADPTMAALA